MRRTVILLWLLALAGCSAPPAPPVADGASFTDRFDGDSHQLTGWENLGGRWELWDEATAPSPPHSLDQRNANLSTPAQFIATGHGTFGSVDVRVSFHLLPGAVVGAGVVVRYVDERNYYVVSSQDRGGLVKLEEYHAGVATELQRTTRSFEGSTWTLLGVRVQGDRFTVTIDSEQAFNVHDPTLQVGHVGLWTPPGARAQFDDLEVTRL